MRVLTKYGVNDSAGALNARYYVNLAGNSLETKPTEMIADGSICLETDTGDVYVFNETASTWVKYKTIKES